MGLTLREALSLAEPLRRARVLAGERGLDREVEAVNVMEVPDILEWVRPGELLVTTLYPLRDKLADLESLIPRLAEKGLVGLAITPESYIEKIPPCLIEAADKLGFPLIELPPKTSFIDIIQPLTSKILNIQATELRQSEALLRQFLDLILAGGGYMDIAALLAKTVGRPVLLIDRFRRLLGHSPDAEKYLPLFTRDPAGDRYLPESLQRLEERDLGWGQARVWRVLSPAKNLVFVSYPVRASSIVLGEILVCGTLPFPIPHVCKVALEHGATVTALKMMELRALSQVDQQFQNEILEGLLSQQPEIVERTVKMALRVGINLEAPYAVAVVMPDLPVGQVLAAEEGPNRSALDTSLHLARRYIRVIQPKSVFWRQGMRLIVFVPVSEITDYEKVLQALRDVCQRVMKENAPHSVSIGLSGRYSELRNFSAAYQEAMQTLELGRALQSHRHGIVVCPEDLGLLQLIYSPGSLQQLEKFCQNALGSLLAQDRANVLVTTLRAYFACRENLRQTAKLLGIHYNTARYRLRRIHQILGKLMESYEGKLTVEVALQLLPLVRPDLSKVAK